MKGRASRVLAALALAANWACQPVQAPDTAIDKAGPPPGAVWEGEAFTFQQVRDDIYHAVGTGNLTIGCNGSVIINENDVLLVDSHMTPAASWALLKELKSITHKPVRYVVNTHFHFDHAHGNQTFGEDVEIIGHEFTRKIIEHATYRSQARPSMDAPDLAPRGFGVRIGRVDWPSEARSRKYRELNLPASACERPS